MTCGQGRATSLTVAVVSCAMLGVACPATAAEWSGELELAMSLVEERWTLAPTLRAAYGLSKRWRLRGEWGFVSAAQGSEGEHGWTQLESGNLLLGLDSRGGAGALRWRLGAGLTAPLAHLEGEHDPHGRSAYGDASMLQGLWDLWLWAPDRIGLVVPAGAVIKGDRYRLGLEAGAAMLVPVRETLGTSVDALTQARIVAALHSAETFEAGAQLQSVLIATQPSDGWQTAIAPFVRLQLGPVELGARLLLPIDAPLGGHWSFQLAASVRGTDAD
ncbi:MAG: hypothetical protein HY901_01030 [Deltaproteobacteria bacterium]|nr:hypothetical protein [Deltaproteobacteria bacterium]